MKRSQWLITIFGVELLLALLLVYNYGYLTARRQNAPLPVALVADNVQAQPAVSPTVASAAPPSTLIPELSPAILSLFDPLPGEATPGNYKISDDLINLGRMLWYDPRLSISQQQSCNTCHPLDRYGADGLPVSVGANGQTVKRNAQSVYNSAFHIAQFWDGRAPTVEEQAKVPILGSGEMAMLSPAQVEAVVRSIPGYEALFAAAFADDPGPITYAKVSQAIGAFERRLVTPSRFDLFLSGDYARLTPDEQRGLATFVSVGCTTCHVGVTVGGLLFKKLGEVQPYSTSDLGRFEITRAEADRYVFKVQSLRNIVKTAPYLHDGSIQTLDEMVRLMGWYQLGKQLTDTEVTSIITFLNTLTGEIPVDYITPPALPESGPDTQLAYQVQ
jgi:cytochrome c peroxidase